MIKRETPNAIASNKIDELFSISSRRPLEEGGAEIQTASEIENYSKVLQGKGINGLISSSTAPQAMQIDAYTHTGKIDSDGVAITIDEEAIGDISAQTFKVLIILLTALTAQLPHGDIIPAEAIQRGRIVKLSLEDYMSACRIKDKKEARAQLNAAIKTIYAVSLAWDEQVYEKPEGKSRKVKITKHHRMRITDHTITEAEGNPVRNGAAEIHVSFDMAEYLSNSYIMPYPDALLSINTHYHPYSIPLGWKLCALHNMNFGKSTQNKTTVETLLRAAKGIPSYNRIASKGQIYDRIVKPFDRDILALVEAGVLASYYYFDEEGKKVDTQALGSLSYVEFSKLNIHYEMRDYPDQTPRIEEKSKRIRAAIRRNNAKKKAEETGEEGKT